MTPPTVNAYYNPLENNINFPAGILQPPFYDAKADDAVNFGAIGAVIGHELTHGFDDRRQPVRCRRAICATGGRRKTANSSTSWKACFVNEYDSFVAVDDVHVNGKLTLGENTADNGGLRIAHMALLDVLANNSGEADRRLHAGPALLRRLGADLVRERASGVRAHAWRRSNEHSPGKFRVNGVVGNMPEFAEGLRLQGRCADGAQARLPRLVGGDGGIGGWGLVKVSCSRPELALG